MTNTSKAALETLRRMAQAHPGASSGESAAWEILQNLRTGSAVDFSGSFVHLDSCGRQAVVQLLLDLTTGGTGMGELRSIGDRHDRNHQSAGGACEWRDFAGSRAPAGAMATRQPGR